MHPLHEFRGCVSVEGSGTGALAALVNYLFFEFSALCWVLGEERGKGTGDGRGERGKGKGERREDGKRGKRER